jgi:hypothetical protein
MACQRIRSCHEGREDRALKPIRWLMQRTRERERCLAFGFALERYKEDGVRHGEPI